jgi:hypothetical protein
MVRILFALVIFAGAAPVSAQQDAGPSGDIFAPGLVAPNLDFRLNTPDGSLTAPVPYGPGAENPTLVQAPGRRYDLVLQARLVADGELLSEGVTWRVFDAHPDASGELPLLLETEPGGTSTVQLPTGEYFVHAAFGRAGATKRVTILDDSQMESVVLNAGGLKLDSVVGEDQPAPPERLSFEILQENESGDLLAVVPNASANRVIPLSAGTYHVVSRYGGVNAVVRADIEVEPGKLTEATMRHTGAEVTLKLVSEEGGEALANTSWAVTTQDGITVHESIGAFPSIVLAAGTYTAVAKHQDEIYSRDFVVETGIERDIEVRLEDLVQPETGTIVRPDMARELAEP